jgi:hypothetical protein
MDPWLLLLLAGLSPARPALAATASASVAAEIIAPAALQSAGTLSLGTLWAGSSGGVVALAPDGTRTLRGDLAGRQGQVRAACLQITAPPGASFSLLLPATVALRCAGTSHTLLADCLSLPLHGALPGGGAAVVYIGATVHIGPNQAPGLYRGDLEIQVCYH